MAVSLMELSTGCFLARKLDEAYSAQRRTTWHLAELSCLAGPAAVSEWLKIPVDDNAPTPLTFREKTKDYAKSVYMWSRAECRSCGAIYRCAKVDS